MRPTPIPDNEVPDGAVRRVFAAPGGALDDPDIAPVEALIGVSELGPVVSVRCVLEPGELILLAAGGTVWLHWPWFPRAVPPRRETEGAVTSWTG